MSYCVLGMGGPIVPGWTLSRPYFPALGCVKDKTSDQESHAVGGKSFIGSVIAVAARSFALWLVASLCLMGCAGRLTPPQSPSPQASSGANPLPKYGDVLNDGSPSGAKPGSNPGGSGANTKPVIYYGDTSARQVIAVGEARPSGGESRSGIRPVAYVTAGVGPAEGDKFQVTFENADIKTVVRAILGDTLKANYFIDPRVHGTISLSAQRPVSRDQLMLLLETALRDQGAVLVRQEDAYRILPATEAHAVGGINIGPDAGMPGFGITALPLENISAEALNKILEGFGAAPGSVHVDQSRNLLIVRGTTSERQWLIDTALAFDVDWMRNQSVGIFPVKSGSPEIIINELNQMADSSLVKFQPISRLNAVLAVSRSRDAIRQVSTWIARLDRQNDYGPRVHVFRLKSADARKVVAVLKDVFGSGASSTANEPVAPWRTYRDCERHRGLHQSYTRRPVEHAGSFPDQRKGGRIWSGVDRRKSVGCTKDAHHGGCRESMLSSCMRPKRTIGRSNVPS